MKCLLNRLMEKSLPWLHDKCGRESYSQCGEDLIVDFIFTNILPGKTEGEFVDIGAHHPTQMNNTYLFYKKGWKGLNVEPMAEKIVLFEKKRPKDVSVSCGIGTRTELRDFYVMDPPTLSTYDKHIAESYGAFGHKINRIEKVSILSVPDLISKYSIGRDIDILTIDIEGDELLIIKDFVAKGVKPKILICETLEYTPHLSQSLKEHKKINEILNLGYILYADTYINSIFISVEFWK